MLEDIVWEAVIVDECQRSTTSEYFGKIKMLITDMKILLACGELKVRSFCSALSDSPSDNIFSWMFFIIVQFYLAGNNNGIL